MARTIEFPRPDGKTAPGYLADPPHANATPGIVLLQEWWGLDGHIKQTADRLAAAGFRVLAPDLYRGRVAATGDEANHLLEGLDFTDAATQDAAGAARYLTAQGAPKVAVMGFCMGGVLAVICAMHVPQFAAAVVFYGYPPPQAGDPSAIRIPILGHWAEHDAFFPLTGVDALETKLAAGGVPYEFYRYDAKHAFYNPGGLGNHHPKHADLAWQRTIAFLNRALN